MKKNFDDKVREAGNTYRPEPRLEWSQIEFRLKKKRARRVSLRRWLAIAASLVIILVSVFIFFSKPVEEETNSLFVQSSSVTDLRDLPSDHAYLAKYSVNDLYYAYHEAGLLPSRD